MSEIFVTIVVNGLSMCCAYVCRICFTAEVSTFDPEAIADRALWLFVMLFMTVFVVWATLASGIFDVSATDFVRLTTFCSLIFETMLSTDLVSSFLLFIYVCDALFVFLLVLLAPFPWIQMLCQRFL